ncbi:hypothetical protein [Paeniglutamicibacter gangotriensis]|uniref:Uncharacterized protein n=1 Tax=Paeniglutamicibacter gangotriensis Lz1y TaxID=1276920 RepID=M7MM17_9MICC|nr:hypothetical protein [Paeniglutamicibacter gangotriensis]EMQ97362.1 hypothetical protein ADIAG_03157 [Paeniglutamicibacter gangotriensis Lz1y]
MHPSHDETPVSGSHAAVPANVRYTQEDFDDLKPAYSSWLEAQSLKDPASVLGNVGFVLVQCALLESDTVVTALSVEALKAALETIAEVFPEALEDMRQAMGGFMEFLDESDEFSGSDQHFEHLYELVVDDEEDAADEWVDPRLDPATARSIAEMIKGPPSPPVSWYRAPHVTVKKTIKGSSLGERETHTAVEWLPLTMRARAFLQWLGKGRAITAGGSLRRRDFKDAAATLGEDALGVSQGATAGSWIPGVPGTWKARQMWEAPSLDAYWNMLLQAGLIERATVRMTTHKYEKQAVPTELGKRFLAREPKATVEAVRGMATVGYKLLAGIAPVSSGHPIRGSEPFAKVLVAAATDTPMPTHLVAAVTQNPGFIQDEVSGLIYPRVGERLYLWGGHGLVDLGDAVTIPEVLLPSLASALAEEHGLDVEEPGKPEQSMLDLEGMR